MFTLKAICTLVYSLAVLLYLIHSTNAGYTGEETDEKTKSLYSAVTSILGSTDSSKNHHKQTYGDGPSPCVNAGSCSTDIPSQSTDRPGPARDSSSCPSPHGCPIVSPSSNSISASGRSQGGYFGGEYGTKNPASPSYVSAPHPGGFYGGSYGSNYPPYPSSVSDLSQLPLQSGFVYRGYSIPHGSVGSGSSSGPTGSYNIRQSSAPYDLGNGHYGYQDERGYSVLDHYLKTNSEYTEVGTHNGPLQPAPNGYGYGSGYGGYMGMYNRPGF